MSTLIKHKEFFQKERTQITTTMPELLALAKKEGASQADVLMHLETGFSVSVRMGNVETVEHNHNKGAEITVFFGHQKGSASSTDLSQESLTMMVKKACEIAKYTTADPFSGLADKEFMAFQYPDLDLYHPWDINTDDAIAIATACEGLARQDKRITNSDGAAVSNHEYLIGQANSHGFAGLYQTTRHDISLSLIAEEQGQMERDYSFTLARDVKDMWPYQKVAQDAVHRTVSRLKPRKLTTQRVPVIFEASRAISLLGHFFAGITGPSLYRQASFLVNSLGKQVFPTYMQIHEAPHIKKGLASMPFDNEGVITKDRDIVRDGTVQGYILATYSARKLGMQTTGNAGGLHNIILDTSNLDLPGLMKKMQRGLLVTELMGQGVNIINGDYSRGAAGFWIENGEIQYPVSGITIAGNLVDMFKNMVAIGNDVDLRYGIRTGSILIEQMIVAGD